MSGTKTLRYEGGADLTFRDKDQVRHKVAKGEDFETDAETAAILLTDPAVKDVAAMEAGEAAAAAAAGGYSGMSAKELAALAKERGLKVRGKNAEIIARLEDADAAAAAEAAAAEADNAGGESGQDEDGEGAEGDGALSAGAITLGDMPDSAKVQG